MSKDVYEIGIDTLESWADAVRSQNGSSYRYTTKEIADEIASWEVDPTENLHFIAALVSGDTFDVYTEQLDGVSVIGPYVFYNCYLRNFTIPDTVTKIGEHAFAIAQGLSLNINIPDSVTEIGEYAFSNFRGNLKLPKHIEILKFHSFSGARALPHSEMDSVIHIEDQCFQYSLSSKCDLSGCLSLLSIGKEAFADCDSLRVVKFPNTYFSIAELAFGECPELNRVYLPGEPPEIASDSFDLINDNVIYIVSETYYENYRNDNWSKHFPKVRVNKGTVDGIFTVSTTVDVTGSAYNDVYLTVDSDVLSGEYEFYIRSYFSSGDLRSSFRSGRCLLGETLYLNDVFYAHGNTVIDIEIITESDYYGVYENAYQFDAGGL